MVCVCVFFMWLHLQIAPGTLTVFHCLKTWASADPATLEELSLHIQCRGVASHGLGTKTGGVTGSRCLPNDERCQTPGTCLDYGHYALIE